LALSGSACGEAALKRDTEHRDKSITGSRKVIENDKGAITYVAIGASDVVGVGARDPINESWAAVIAKRLPKKSKFVRLGVSGSTAAEAALGQLPTARNSNPDLVTVWLATNDFDLDVPVDEYEKTMDQILGLASGGKTRVFVANIPDLSMVPRYWDQPPEVLSKRVDAWNEAIARAARNNGAMVVDLFEPSKALTAMDVSLVADDGFHPSTEGYELIAELFWNSITNDPVIGPLVREE